MGYKLKIQQGMTLIELSIVLMILAVIAVVSTRFMYDEFDRSIADKTVAEMWAVAEYSVAFISMNDNWPGGDQNNSCTNAEAIMDSNNLLHGLPLQKTSAGGVDVVTGIYSPWYNDSASVPGYVPYNLSCQDGSPESGFTISLTIPSFSGGQSAEEWAQYILQKLPLAKLDDANKSKVILTMPPPSGVFALREYLSRKEDLKRDELNSDGKISRNDLEAVINVNTDSTSGKRKVVDFDVDQKYDLSNIGDKTEFFTEEKAIYSLNMPRTSVFNRLVLIPTTTSGSIAVEDNDYSIQNCRAGSPGGFALEICERDYKAHVDAEDDDDDIDELSAASFTHPIINTPKIPRGSIKANDIYLESIGKWASDIDNEMIPNWMLVEHFSEKNNGNDIKYSQCPSGRTSKYEVWPKKIAVDTKPTNSGNKKYSGEHVFEVSSGGYISIYWPGIEEKTDADGVVTNEQIKHDDNSSRVYANVYCVKN